MDGAEHRRSQRQQSGRKYQLHAVATAYITLDNLAAQLYCVILLLCTDFFLMSKRLFSVPSSRKFE